MMKETQKDKIIRLRKDGYLPVEIARMTGCNPNNVYAVLSNHGLSKNGIKPEPEQQIVQVNMTLKIVNSIFNTNPIIKNPNRMAAY